MTERTARVAHSRGLAAPDRRLRAQGRAPGPRGPQRASPPPASLPLSSLLPPAPTPGNSNVRLHSGPRKRRPAWPFPAPGGGDSLPGPGDSGPVPLTRAGNPSAAGRGSRNWPRSARVAAAGRGAAGSFRRPAAGWQPQREVVHTAGRGPQPPQPRPAVPTRSPAGRAARGPRSATGSGSGDGETRARGHPSFSSRPASSPGRGKGETKGRWGGSPRTPSRPPRPARPLLVVAEDLVGDFTVENFLVGPQVRRRLLSHKRLSV